MAQKTLWLLSLEMIAVEGFIWAGFFFVLSGLILSYSHNPNAKFSGRYAWEFPVKRITRIYPTHILMLIVWVFFFVGGFQYVDLKEPSINALLLQSWIPNPKSYWGFNPVSWSISCEMFLCFVCSAGLVEFKNPNCACGYIASRRDPASS